MATDPSDKKPKHLRTRAVAARRGVSERTVRMWIAEKGLPAKRTSGARGHWRVLETDLAEWLRDRDELH